MNIQTILPICYIYMLFSTIKLCHYTDYPFIRHILFPPTIVPTDNIPILLHMQNTMQYIFPVRSSIKWKVISLQSSMNRFYNNCILRLRSIGSMLSPTVVETQAFPDRSSSSKDVLRINSLPHMLTFLS